MKKIIVVSTIAMLSLSVMAKGSSHVSEDSGGVIGSCMVKVDDANSSRFINVAYIRSIEVVRLESDEKASPNVLNIRMASNYSAKSVYSINYGSEVKALDALQDLAYKINNCGKKE